MKLLVATDAHLFVLPDNTYWCDSVETYDFWKRYLDVFDTLRIVARVKHIEKIDNHYRRVDGPNIEIWEIPFYQGPKQLLKNYFKIWVSFKKCYDSCDCAIFRLPSQTAFMAFSRIPQGMPYGGEIVYCQRDSLIGLKFGIKKILNIILSQKLKKFCKKANGVSYVTKEAIQKYYPSHAQIYGETDKYFSTYYSSIVLDKKAYSSPRDYTTKKELVLVISDAAMNGERKGERVVIQIIQKLRKKNLPIFAYIIGDGSKRKEFEELTKKLNVDKYISFVGKLSTAQEVRKYLSLSDIYILPTQGEGLPRGILEAMALGMPVLSTQVGGIPEIIEDKYLFASYDVNGFSAAIEEFLKDPLLLNKISIRNFNKALEYNAEVLQKKRNEFYNKLKKLV